MRRFIDKLSFRARAMIVIVTFAVTFLVMIDDPQHQFAHSAMDMLANASVYRK